MKILSLDSSGMVASAALLTDDILTAEYTLNHKKTHSQTLMSMLDEIIRMTDWDMETVDAIAIAKGPGSFTGLRIGSAAVKGLAHALNRPIAEVSTLEAMAYQAYGYRGAIVPVMDARRSQVYTATCTFDEKGRFITLMEPSAISVEDCVAKLNELNLPVMLMGDGVPVYEEKIRSLAGFDILIAPPHMNRQRAASVAVLGAMYVKEGRTVSAAEHTPLYLRRPQAEREKHTPDEFMVVNLTGQKDNPASSEVKEGEEKRKGNPASSEGEENRKDNPASSEGKESKNDNPS